MAVERNALDNFNNGFFESSTSTVFKKAKYQHKWSIHDFGDYCDLREHKIESSVFSDGIQDGLKWRLEINRNGWYYDNGNKFLSLDIILVSNNADNLEAICELSILNARQEQLKKVKKVILFNKTKVRENKNMFINKNEFLDPKNQYLQDNKLTILCEIVMLGNNENFSSQFAMPNDLGLLLFENPDYTVVTFSVLGRELCALKTVLIANSPVFAAMFQHDTKENKTNRIEIKDIDYTVLQEMLRFIYTNKVSNLDDIADRLLTAADKYALENLKRRCEESMIKNLAIANAHKFYVLADQHNVEDLKIRAKNFIVANARNIMLNVQCSAGYRSLLQAHPQLFNDSGLPI